MVRKSGLISTAIILLIFTLYLVGGAAVREKPDIKQDVKQWLMKVKLLPVTGQSEVLPIQRKPSPIATPNALYYQNSVIVLMYHEVTDTQSDPKTLLLSRFKEQIKLMQENGFHWISMEQYKNFLLNHASIPDNAVLMTFDDGYESFYQDAYPILKENHIPATNFIIVNTVDNPKHSGVQKLTWEQIRQMHRNGIDFYNHTFDSHSYAYADVKHRETRPLLAGPVDKGKAGMETEAEFKNRIYKDLLKAQIKLHEEVGNTDDILAFPYGAFSEDTIKVCRSLGIDITFTVKRGMNRAGQLNGYRVNAGGADNDPAVLVEYMKEGAPEPVQTQTLNRPYDLFVPDDRTPPVTALMSNNFETYMSFYMKVVNHL